MRYSVTSEQLDHLRREGVLEFAEIYKEEKRATLKDFVEKANSDAGRDLQKQNPLLLKTLNTSMLGQIAAQLYRQKQIKIAFTQILPCYGEAATLTEISSVSEIFGGAVIDLATGDTHFYLPTTLLDFPNLEGKWLVAFTTEKARYVIQQKDPHTHYLKKLGYAAGDRLSDQTHPLIHR